MLIIICFVVSFISDILAATVENPFKACNTEDSNFDHCLAQSIQEAIVSLRDGNKDLGVISLEPIEVPSLVIPGHGAVNFDQHYTDIKLNKMTHGTVTKASWNKDDKIIFLQYHLPEAELSSQYEVNGKILLLPIQGKGDASIKLFDLILENTIEYEEKENKNGDKIFKIVDYKVKLIPKGAHYYLGNLFNGNKELGDNVLNVMNDNWEAIFNDVKESYEQWFASIFRSFARRIFSKIAAKDILLE